MAPSVAQKKRFGANFTYGGWQKRNLVVERSRDSVQRIEPESGRDYSLTMTLLKKLKGRTPTQSGAEAFAFDNSFKQREIIME